MHLPVASSQDSSFHQPGRNYFSIANFLLPGWVWCPSVHGRGREVPGPDAAA